MMSKRVLQALVVGLWIWSAGLCAAETREEVRARWQDAIELDSPAVVVKEGKALVGAGGSAARDGELLALYARALAATGGTQRAFELLRAAQPTDDTRVAVELGLARLELEQDLLTELIRRLAPDKSTPAAEQGVRYPQQADAWWLLGKARYRLGETQAAEALLQHFVQTWRMHPQAPSAWHLLSQAALARRELDAARKYRDQGQNLSTWHGYYKTRRMQVRENPKDHLPHYGLAQLWSSVDEWARATASLDRALELQPEFARGWALRGELLRKQGQATGALEAYGRALELDKTLTDARFNRALLAMQAGDSQLALTDLRSIVEGSESTATRYLGAHLALARVLGQLGQNEEAKQRYERYRELGGTEPRQP